MVMQLPESYRFKLASMPRNGQLGLSIPHACNIPKHAITVDYNLNCLLCTCDGWLPVPVGQVLDFATLDQVWNSELAQQLQQDIDSKKYTWCAVDHCGIRYHDNMVNRYTLQINIDESCNLACPSCRRDPIMHTTGPEFQRKQQAVARIVEWLAEFPHPIHVTTSGNGDPLASLVMRTLLKQYRPREGQTFTLFTNGLLIKKQLDQLPILNSITDFSISVDAACADTYAKIRRGGDWAVLIENFEYLKSQGLSRRVVLKFCIQQSNFRELGQFIDLCRHYGFAMNLHQLDDWGTWSNEPESHPDAWTIANGSFQDHNVLNSNHPNYAECQSLVRDIITKPAYGPGLFSPRTLQLLQL